MTKVNKHTGEFEIRMGGRLFTGVFDWHALSELETAFGSPSELAKVLKPGGDALSRAKFLAIALKQRHPEVTAEKILEWRPPLFAMLATLDAALNAAYFGPDEAQGGAEKGDGADGEDKDAGEPTSKKAKSSRR